MTSDEKRDWAADAQNPLADIIKLEKAYLFSPGYGHKDRVDFTHRYSPYMASALSDNWNMVNRIDFLFKYQPGTYEGEKDSFGLGDTTYQGLFSPSGHEPFFWGVGPLLQIPTATDPQIGTRKWSAGLAAAAFLDMGPVTGGFRAGHLWSFAGKDDRPDVNLTLIEYRLFYNFSDGWWIGTSPVNTANWEAPSDEIWTIPVGGGFGKIVGNKYPINMSIEAYSYVDAPDYEADWTCMLRFDFLANEQTFYKEPNQ
jgi:hypothetical protein